MNNIAAHVCDACGARYEPEEKGYAPPQSWDYWIKGAEDEWLLCSRCTNSVEGTIKQRSIRIYCTRFHS